MHLLVTNDDGVFAPGLLALAQELRKIGVIDILAPDKNWSGGGHVKTIDRPLRIREVILPDGSIASASDGAPSDCVALALLGYLPEKVDLVVSGINPSANVGHDVTYSGTVTAAMEAVIWGVPAIAVSLDVKAGFEGSIDYTPAARIAGQIVQSIQAHSLPAGILLNVNIPNLPAELIVGARMTRQGMRVYRDRLDRRTDPRGHPYFWIGGDSPTGLPELGTDIGALSDGFVSITPLQLDLTAYPALHMMNNREWQTDPGAGDKQEYAGMPSSELLDTPTIKR